MSHVTKFVVSTPCSDGEKTSGYRVVMFHNDRLSIVPMKKLHDNDDKGVIIQAFCYIKPRDRDVIPAHLNSDRLDASDYMFMVKSNGLIEVIRDFQYKSSNNISLNPDYILVCTSGHANEFSQKGMVIGLEYKDGFLYCCQKSGNIFVFILNIPADYESVGNFSNSFESQNTAFPLNYSSEDEDVQIDDSVPDDHSFEDKMNDFLNKVRYTGRDKIRHLCYFLNIVELPDRSCFIIRAFGTNLYNKINLFRPSIYTTIEGGITMFRINPFDKLSFVVSSISRPLMIKKIVLPQTWLNFMVTFIKLKRVIYKTSTEEVLSWENMTNVEECLSVPMWLLSHLEYGNSSFYFNRKLWLDILERNGTVASNPIVVWKQEINRIDHDFYQTLYKQINFETPDSDTLFIQPDLEANRNSPPSIRIERMAREYARRRLHTFARNVGKCSHVIDFQVFDSNYHPVYFTTFHKQLEINLFKNLANNTSSPNKDNSLNSIQNTENIRSTSFLTDTYNNLNIAAIDMSLIFSTFKPKFQDTEAVRLDLFHRSRNFSNNVQNNLTITTRNEDEEVKCILTRFTSFKKMFVLDKYLFLILDVSGLLLINLNLNGSSEIEEFQIKVCLFPIGMIQDAIISNLRVNSQNEQDTLCFTMITTCLSGEIKGFNVKFSSESKIGILQLKDCLKLNTRNKFVDKICLFQYDSSNFSRKRNIASKETNENTDFIPNLKRTKK